MFRLWWGLVRAAFLFLPILFQGLGAAPVKHSTDLKTLKLVQVVFRHGDRSPIGYAFPNDPYDSLAFWPDGYGQLTKEGKMMQYNLGQYLRMRYAGFLNTKYTKDEVYARSSDLDRTIMSAQAHLAGLFPPEDKKDLWNRNILWQPIPVHTLHSSIDNKINVVADCPRYKTLLQKVLESTHIRQLNEDHQDLYDYLTKHSGRTVLDFTVVAEIYDTLFVQDVHGLKLPEWTKAVYPEKMLKLAILPFELISNTKEMSRLRAGPLLHSIIQNMDVNLNQSDLNEAEMKNFPKAKLYINSGHDTTVTVIMSALDIYDKKHIPPYASILFIELHKDGEDGEPFVKIFYKNETSGPPQELFVPGCGSEPSELCSLRKFKKVVAGVTLGEPEWSSECSINPSFKATARDVLSSVRNASKQDKVVKQVKKVWVELYDSYVRPLVRLVFH